MSTWYIATDTSSSLYHFGILGMKWGIRRYQNADGTYNAAGKKRYGIGDGESYEGVKGSPSKSSSKGSSSESSGGKKKMSTAKKVAIAAGVTVAVGLTAYGAYKYSKVMKNKANLLAIERGQQILNTQFGVKKLRGGKLIRDDAPAIARSEAFVKNQMNANKKLSKAIDYVKSEEKLRKSQEAAGKIGSAVKKTSSIRSADELVARNKAAVDKMKAEAREARKQFVQQNVNELKSAGQTTSTPKPKLSFGTDNSSGFSNANFQKTLDSLKSVSAKSLNTVNSAGDDVLSFTKDLAKMNMNDLYKLGF